MNNKNNVLITIVVTLIVGVIAFFGGMQYQKMQRITFTGGQFGGRGGNLSQGNRQFGTGNGVNRPVAGEIISQDDTSITIKMQDGSTKIIILSDKTAINKASTGTKADLKTGEQVGVFGTTNSDGSVTAQNISIGGAMFRGIRTVNPSGQPVNK